MLQREYIIVFIGRLYNVFSGDGPCFLIFLKRAIFFWRNPYIFEGAYLTSVSHHIHLYSIPAFTYSSRIPLMYLQSVSPICFPSHFLTPLLHTHLSTIHILPITPFVSLLSYLSCISLLYIFCVSLACFFILYFSYVSSVCFCHCI